MNDRIDHNIDNLFCLDFCSADFLVNCVYDACFIHYK